jgi:hypothetical protein
LHGPLHGHLSSTSMVRTSSHPPCSDIQQLQTKGNSSVQLGSSAASPFVLSSSCVCEAARRL